MLTNFLSNELLFIKSYLIEWPHNYVQEDHRRIVRGSIILINTEYLVSHVFRGESPNIFQRSIHF